jgi:Uma2 family endonuclease
MASVVLPPESPPAVAPAPPPPVPDDILYEVVNGQIREKPPMGLFASLIASRLARHLGLHAETQRLGEVTVEALFRLRGTDSLQRRPDVAFVAAARYRGRPLMDVNAWDVVPNLAVEVISPTNLAEEVLDRIGEYFGAGVEMVWLIYPRHRQVHSWEAPTRVRILTEQDDLDGGSVVSGFRLPLRDLFSVLNQPAP